VGVSKRKGSPFPFRREKGRGGRRQGGQGPEIEEGEDHAGKRE